jgi:uncharacterized protein involved in tolerance to divalent cations
MINIMIYFEKLDEAQILINQLLNESLIANASIDSNNVSYMLKEGVIQTKIYAVVTAQTKNLLFSQIEKIVAEKFGDRVLMYSLPITNANIYFDQEIRNKTLRA